MAADPLPVPTPPVAVISGGSSGIGLAVARILHVKAYAVVLLARDPKRLAFAHQALLADGESPVRTLALDVTDENACEAAIACILKEFGRIDWLVTSAGMAEPGMFLDLPSSTHRQQMDVNFFGTLNLVRPVASAMSRSGGGRITMISSAAAFVGIAGYSGYAPGKFAVRALAETLRVELALAGVAVSVAFPPDTDTPQLAAEQALKPEATKQITAGGGLLSADTVAQAIVRGAEAGRFMLTPGVLMSAFGWLHSLYAPFFRRQQLRILRRLGSETRSGNGQDQP